MNKETVFKKVLDLNYKIDTLINTYDDIKASGSISDMNQYQRKLDLLEGKKEAYMAQYEQLNK